MRRCIVVSSRVGEDSETHDKLLYMDLCRLPNKMKDGGLWYPKRTEVNVTTCVNAVKKPDLFNKLKDVLPCTLVDIEYGINEFTDKRFVASIEVVDDTKNPFDISQLYL